MKAEQEIYDMVVVGPVRQDWRLPFMGPAKMHTLVMSRMRQVGRREFLRGLRITSGFPPE